MLEERGRLRLLWLLTTAGGRSGRRSRRLIGKRREQTVEQHQKRGAMGVAQILETKAEQLDEQIDLLIDERGLNTCWLMLLLLLLLLRGTQRWR